MKFHPARVSIQFIVIMNLSSALHLPVTASARQESRLDYYFSAFMKRWKLLLALPLICAIAAGLISLLVPDVYKARTNILPRQMNQTNAAAMLSQANNLASNTANALNIRIPIDPNVRLSSELYVALLKSNSMADALIKRFSLNQYYGVQSMDKTRRILFQKTSIRTTKEGLIDISVEDRQPQQAALLANAYVEELQKLLQKLELTDASQRRRFFEQKLQSFNEKMTVTQATLENLSADQNAETMRSFAAQIATAAGLRAQISFKEIQLGASQAFFTAETSDSDNARTELNRLRSELAKFENEDQSIRLREAHSAVKAAINSAVPQLMHDVKYYQTLVELLTSSYRIAVGDEAKESVSALRVIDQATPPELPASPNRILVALLAGLTGLLLAIIIILFLINAANTKPVGTR